MMLKLLAIMLNECIGANEFDKQQREIVYAGLTSLQVQVHGMLSSNFETMIIGHQRLKEDYAL